MSSVQKKTTKTTKTVTTKKTEQVQSSVDQSADVQTFQTQKSNNLSIVKKGQFFNDSYFEDTRQAFQDAVQDVLVKWGDKSKPTTDINSYRDLRARDLRDENQAIKSTEDQRYHKIVVDVQDFINGGEVSVKTLDEVEIVVEGRVQRKIGNTTSTKSFKRTFILPDIEPESITSVVSSDGVLIIKALKKVSEMDVSESVTVQKTMVTQEQTSTVQTSEHQDVKQIAITVQDTQPPAIASPQPDQQKTVTVTKQVTSTATEKPLPIAQKGGFFEDTFFEDCRQHFQTAVKQVLQKCNVTSTDTDDLTTYRNLRQKDLREENQVATVDESTDIHKIIVDVKDFLNGGEVTVKTVEEREVVIEGHIEKQEGNKKTIKRFCKRFILPEDIIVESVTSVVSSDGVLTITARKKEVDSAVETTQIIQKKVITTVQSQQQDVDTTQKKPVDSQQTKVTKIKKTKVVTITTTNVPFFNDPTFADDVKDFKEAITTIIKNMKVTVTDTDEFTAYRNKRKINPRNENQAISEKVTDTTKKIILDVCDFIGGVTVKVDEQMLIIEGKANRHTEGGGVQTFSFKRQYSLPDDVNPDDVTAVMTPDGILIITIVTKQAVTSSVVTKQETQVKKEITEQTTVDTKKAITEEPKPAPAPTPEEPKKTTTTTVTKTTKTVTITTKGPFFNDPTFAEDVKDFQEAITTIIKKLNLTVTETDVFTTYRNYRKNNPPKNENQAIAEKDTDTVKKIVIDVCDFVGNVTVKVVENELIIEGEGKRPTETGAIQTITFTRRFSLPEDVTPDDVTAVMSSEGILIITIIRRIVKITKVKKDTTDVTETKKEEPQPTKTTKTTTTKTIKTVTITTTKTSFFEEPTFVEDVKDFQEAITTIIKKLNLTVTDSDVFTAYRNKRKINPRNENQAISEKETDTTKKIVMDVCDFIGGVTVKVEEQILTVEGKGNRHTEGGGVQTFNFNRQFILPDDVNPDDVTAVMTTEGILIITIIRRKVVTSRVVTKEETQVKKETTELTSAPTPEEPKPTPTPEQPKPAPAPEQPKTAPAPEEPKPAPAPEQPKPAPAPQEPKPAPAPEQPKPAPAPEAPKPAPAPEEPKPAPAPEEPKPAPTPEQPKSAPAPEEPKPAPAPEEPKPAPAPEEPKPAPAPEEPKPAPAPEEPKPAPAPEQAKPAPTPEEPKKAPVLEAPKPAPAPEEPKPAPAPEQPKSAPAPEEPKPAPAPEPKLAPVPEQPKPAPAPEEPKPTPAPEQPKPAPTPEEPKKAPVLEAPKPAPVPEEPKPAPAPEEHKPAPAPEAPKPAPAPETPKPVPAPQEPKPAPTPKEPKPAPAPEEPKPTPAPKEPKPAPAPEEPKPAPAPKEPKPTPAPEEPKPAPAPKEPKPTPAPEQPKEAPTEDVTKKTTTTTTKTTKTVTVTTTKTPFFKEPTFVEDVKDFQEAITTIIKKLNLKVTETDVFTVYRNYRKNNPPKNENQAVSEKDTDTTKKIVIDVSDFTENVTVKVVERELVIEGQGKRPTQTGAIQTFNFTRRFTLPEDVTPEDVTATVSSEGILIITIIRRIVKVTKVKKDTTDVKETDTKKTVTKKEEPDTKKTVTKKEEPQPAKTTKTTTTKTTKTVTITTTKTSFFEEPTFVEDVKDFQEVITTIVKKLKLTVTGKDVFTVYRNYRKNNPKDENQAVSEKETDTTKKIVIDMSDFTENLSVKVVENELVIESQGKKPTDTFTRRFPLPEGVTPEDVTATMSNEGILIITIIRRIVKVTKVKKDTTDVKQTETKKTEDETRKTTTTTTTKTTKTVTITTKGPFMKDPAFVEDVKDFQEVITTIVKKLKLTITGKDVFTVYRNHRKNNPKDENQAVSEKETDTTKKIVIDVCEFTNNLTVKIVDNELVIEGRGKKPTDTFTRRFPLPEGVTPEDVTATMSSEGILIITIIRRIVTKKTTTTTKKTVTITTKGPFYKDPTFVEDVKNFDQAITTVIKKFNLKITQKDAYTTYRNYRKTNPKNENQAVSEKETDKTKKIVIDVSDFTESVTIRTEERDLVIEGEGKRKTTTGAIQTFSFNRHFCLPEGATTDDITAVKSSEGILSVAIKKTVASSTTTTTESSETTTSKVIKITVKGPFFSDPAFANNVKEFQGSITTIVKKFNVKVTGTDAFTAYRNYRKENPKNENQAVSVNDTDKVKTVVMDVCDFVGATTVKVEGKEVVVSGTGKRQKGGTGPVITFSFGRRFSLYDNTIIDAITAVMSSEGILTITIPRKEE